MRNQIFFYGSAGLCGIATAFVLFYGIVKPIYKRQTKPQVIYVTNTVTIVQQVPTYYQLTNMNMWQWDDWNGWVLQRPPQNQVPKGYLPQRGPDHHYIKTNKP